MDIVAKGGVNRPALGSFSASQNGVSAQGKDLIKSPQKCFYCLMVSQVVSLMSRQTFEVIGMDHRVAISEDVQKFACIHRTN
jgi:hypothetical protein